MDSNSYSAYQNPADSSAYTNNSNEQFPSAASSYNHSDVTMPPVAPSYSHGLSIGERNNDPAHYSERETFDRLMDSVYKSRMENTYLGQYPIDVRVEDMQIVNGAIEIRARITPKAGVHLENSYYPDPHQQSLYQPQYRNPYQPPCQPQYQYFGQPYQYQYQHLNPVISPQYRYPAAAYPNQFPGQYLYQYPAANVVGSIANAIALTSYLWRR